MAQHDPIRRGILKAALVGILLPRSARATNTGGSPGRIYDIREFGAVGDGLANDTAAVSAAIAAIKAAGSPAVLRFGPGSFKLGEISFSAVAGLTLDGDGGSIIAAAQFARSFYATGCNDLVVRRFEFRQRAGYHYAPTILLNGCDGALIEENLFSGVGYGASCYGCRRVNFRRNEVREVGVYPRPLPLDPSPAGYGPGFDLYGGGLAANTCDGVLFDHNDLRNARVAGGHTSDRTGGPGGCCAFACNDVEFRGNVAINMPGQGQVATGEWQGTNVVHPILQRTFDYSRRGRDIRFIGGRSEGCNQEGFTAFGCGQVRFVHLSGRNNRFSSIEAWQCWDVVGSGCITHEEPDAVAPMPGGSGGEGAVHIVGSHNVHWSGLRVALARYNGVLIAGSYGTRLIGTQVSEYGRADSPLSYRASGIAFGPHFDDVPQLSSTECAVNDAIFERTPMTNNAGGDFFFQDNESVIYLANCRAIGREITYANAIGSIRGQRPSGG